MIMTASVNRYINPYFNQQHKQLDLTTIAPKTTHWALRDLLKTIVVNRVVNYRQFKEYILFELEECAWRIGNSKQNEEIDNNHKCQLVYKSLKRISAQ